MAVGIREREREKEKEKTKNRFHEIYDALNSEQKEAVDTIEGPVMVLAGPGTGKTQVLAMRIAKILCETQMDPWNILCLTFTDSASVEMRERLVSIIGTPAYYVRIHTFHSFCNEIIQEHPDIFALARDWQPLSDVERVELIQTLLDDLPGTSRLKPFGSPYLFLQDVAEDIQALKQEDISSQALQKVLRAIGGFVRDTKKEIASFVALKPSKRTHKACQKIYNHLLGAAKEKRLADPIIEVFSRQYVSYEGALKVAEGERDASKVRTAFKNDLKRWFERIERNLPKQRDLRRVYDAYQKRLKEMGRYDFEDMVIMVVDELQHNDQLLASYQEQFQYILVDEFQDTNGAQNEVVGLLGSFDDQPNIFVVGDDKQSIYRFQGASLNNMLDFYHRYSNHLTIISLRENYRSQPLILDGARAVIEHNEESITKYIDSATDDLTPVAGLTSKKIQIREFSSEDEEDYYIAGQIQRLIEKGVHPSDVAVLYRYHRDSEGILRALRTLGVPVQLEAGENVLNDKTVDQFLMLLSYIVDSSPDHELANILQYEWLGFDALDVLKVIRYAGSHRISLLTVISDTNNLSCAGVKRGEEYLEFVKHVATWRAMSSNETLLNALTIVITESGLLQYLTEGEKHIGALQRLSTVLTEAKRLNQAQPNVSLRQFMDYISLLRVHDVPLMSKPWEAAAADMVHLMTAHKAKGLEFEHVFVCRLNDRHWGNNREFNRVPLPHGLVRYDYVISQANNEDERRLFYVAMTRAKKSLTLTRAGRNINGRPTVPSLFLHELPTRITVRGESTEDIVHVEKRLADSMAPAVSISAGDDVRAWLGEKLKTYVMSVTHVNNYLECPRKFYIKNVLHIPSVRTPHQVLGTAIHGALQDFFAAYRNSRGRPAKSVLLKAFERYLRREILNDVQRQHVLDVGRRHLAAYYDHYKGEFVRESIGEYNFRSHGITLPIDSTSPGLGSGVRGTGKGGLEEVDIPITGKIDKIEIVDANAKQVNVVDYKTGNPDRGLRKLRVGEDYHRQLVFYKLLCDLSPRFEYQMISGEIDFIQASEKRGFIKKKLEVSNREVEDLVMTITRVWQEIQNLKFLEDDAGCGKCEFCASNSSFPFVIARSE